MNRLPLPPAALLLAVLLLLLCPPAVRADEPLLAIRLAGEADAIYQLGQIHQVVFEDDYLNVETPRGTDVYAVADITRIDFLWTAGARDPGQAAGLIQALHLFQNQPNPFSQRTQIDFELPSAGKVELKIYGPNGRLLRGLLSRTMDAGPHSVLWDGLDSRGERCPGGVYFYSLTGPGLDESRRMILLPSVKE